MLLAIHKRQKPVLDTETLLNLLHSIQLQHAHNHQLQQRIRHVPSQALARLNRHDAVPHVAVPVVFGSQRGETLRAELVCIRAPR